MDILQVSKARQKLCKLINQVSCDHAPIFIKGKKASAVLISAEDWNSIEETLYLLSSPRNAARLRNSMEETEKLINSSK